MSSIEIEQQRAGERIACPQCGCELQVPSATVSGAGLFDDLFDDGADSATEEKTSGTNVTGPLSADTPLATDFDFDHESPTSVAQKTPLEAGFGETKEGSEGFNPSEIPSDSREPSRISRAHSAPPQSPADRTPDSAADDDEDLLLALPEDNAPGEKLSVLARTNPLKVEELAPIVVEGLESAGGPGSGMLSVRCQVCDAGIYASEKLIGQTVECTDCGSKVVVWASEKLPPNGVPPWAATAQKGWQEVRAEQEASDFKLGARVENSGSADVPADWGLPDEKRDLLKPAPKIEVIRDEDGVDVLEGADPNRRVESETVQQLPFIGGIAAARSQTSDRLKSAGSSVAASSAGKRKKTSKPREDDSGEIDLANDEVSPASSKRKTGLGRVRKTDSESRIKGAGMKGSEDRQSGKLEDSGKKSSRIDEEQHDYASDELWTDSGRLIISLGQLMSFDKRYLTWLNAAVRDVELWIRLGAATCAIGLGYWLGEIVWTAMQNENMEAGQKAMSIIFPGFGSFVAAATGWLILMQTAALIFQESGDRRPKHDEWPGFGFSEWLGPFVFWVVTLGAGAFPGLILAVPMYFSPVSAGAAIIASLSAAILAPPLMLAAWYNGSPFKIYSRDVTRHFRGDQTKWLAYFPSSLAAWLIFIVGHGILWIPLPFSSFVGAALQVIGVMLFATSAGLYCGLMGKVVEVARKS